MLYNGLGVEDREKARKKAIDIFKSRFLCQHLKANFMVGKIYYEGRSQLPLIKEHHLYERYYAEETQAAFDSFTRASEKGYGKATLYKARMLQESKKNPFDYYKEAADQRNINGCLRTALAYCQGLFGVEPSYLKANEYFQKALSCKKTPDFLKKWKLTPHFLEKWKLLNRISEVSDVTKKIMLLESMLPDDEKNGINGL